MWPSPRAALCEASSRCASHPPQHRPFLVVCCWTARLFVCHAVARGGGSVCGDVGGYAVYFSALSPRLLGVLFSGSGQEGPHDRPPPHLLHPSLPFILSALPAQAMRGQLHLQLESQAPSWKEWHPARSLEGQVSQSRHRVEPLLRPQGVSFSSSICPVWGGGGRAVPVPPITGGTFTERERCTTVLQLSDPCDGQCVCHLGQAYPARHHSQCGCQAAGSCVSSCSQWTRVREVPHPEVVGLVRSVEGPKAETEVPQRRRESTSRPKHWLLPESFQPALPAGLPHGFQTWNPEDCRSRFLEINL